MEKQLAKQKPWMPPPPSPSLLLLRMRRSRPAPMKSVTRTEIDKFWRRKKMEEEEHLLAAQKAAARLKIRSLMEGTCKLFQENLSGGFVNNGDDRDDKNKLQVGIKDWWTKSKYAYLNQPAVKSMEKNPAPHAPQNICFFLFDRASI